GLQDAFLPVVHHHGTYLPIALQESHDRSFVASASAVNFLGSFVLVHVPSFAADEGFVNLDFASHLLESSVLQGEPDSVIHKPCGFLSNVDSPVNFPGTNAVLI